MPTTSNNNIILPTQPLLEDWDEQAAADAAQQAYYDYLAFLDENEDYKDLELPW
jgi:hypothetical protein